MARRLQSVITNIEVVDTNNRRRLQNIVSMVEVVDTANKRRLQSMVVMVEYVPTVAVVAPKYGPKWQMI
jgi:hypothetical protein